jgi:hypothetical protein
MCDELLVDATRPSLRTADGTTVLFPALQPGTWLHAALGAPTGRARLTVFRSHGSLDSVGGLLTAEIDLRAPTATAAQRAAWSAELAHAGAAPAADGRFALRPLGLRRGRMVVHAAAGLLADHSGPVAVGAAASVVGTLELTAAGADRLRAALITGAPLPVGLAFDHRYATADVAPDPTTLAGGFGAGTFRRVADLRDLVVEVVDTVVGTVVGTGADLPISLTFGRDERVDRYGCRIDGRAHTAGGADGLVVEDRLRWTAGPRPGHVAVPYSIAWANPDWEPVAATLVLPTGGPAVAVGVNPGERIAEVAIVTDLGCAEVGALAALAWTTELPDVDGRRAKNYGGSFIVSGQGPDGTPVRRSVSFPYPPERAAESRFSWTVDLALPSGELRSGSGTITLDGDGDVVVLAADLAPR